jgi:hypothetical protein
MRVTFTDGRTFEARLLGSDDVTDLALLAVVPPRAPAGAAAEDVADAIAALALPQAPLGDSPCLDVGDWVVAVGNPVGLDSSVTLGIVSALRRSAAEVGIPDKRLDFIQTDAAINPGNSGGPLVNEFGEVVGISTAIRADAEGIGFAIPINTAKGVAAALAEGRPVQHPYLGIQARFHVLLARGFCGLASQRFDLLFGSDAARFFCRWRRNWRLLAPRSACAWSAWCRAAPLRQPACAQATLSPPAAARQPAARARCRLPWRARAWAWRWSSACVEAARRPHSRSPPRTWRSAGQAARRSASRATTSPARPPRPRRRRSRARARDTAHRRCRVQAVAIAACERRFISY